MICNVTYCGMVLADGWLVTHGSLTSTPQETVFLTSEPKGEWVQTLGAVIQFLGLFGWISVSYDWWMVSKATINQS